MSKTFRDIPYSVAFERVTGKPLYETHHRKMTPGEILDKVWDGYKFRAGDRTLHDVGTRWFTLHWLAHLQGGITTVTLNHSGADFHGQVILPLTRNHSAHRRSFRADNPRDGESFRSYDTGSMLLCPRDIMSMVESHGTYTPYVRLDRSASTYDNFDNINCITSPLLHTTIDSGDCTVQDILNTSFRPVVLPGCSDRVFFVTSSIQCGAYDESGNLVYIVPPYSHVRVEEHRNGVVVTTIQDGLRVVPLVVMEVMSLKDRLYDVTVVYMNVATDGQQRTINKMAFRGHSYTMCNTPRWKKYIENRLHRVVRASEKHVLNNVRDWYNSGYDLDDIDYLVKKRQSSQWFID